MPRDSTDRWNRLPVAVLLVAACGELLVLGLAAADPTLPVDDAYISFAYARTLAAGAGLRLVPGVTPVEGFSNPAWVAVLALADRAGFDIPVAALILSVTAAMAMALVVFATARRLGTSRWLALLAAWGFVLAPGVSFHMASGLETIVAGLALLLAFRFQVGTSSTAMDVRAGAALLVFALLRPEGALVFLAWIVAFRGPRPWASVLVFACPLGAYLAFRWFYFGQLLPNTMMAKSGLDLATALPIGWRYMSEFATLNAPVLSMGVLGLWSVGGRVSLAALVPSLVLAVTALGGAHAEGMPFQRYLFPLLPLALVLAAAGAQALLQLGRRYGELGFVVAGAGLLGVVGGQGVLRASGDVRSGLELEAAAETARRVADGDRAPHDVDTPPYHRLSTWLRARARPSQIIAMQEIGITAYYSGLYVLDTYGLANAFVARAPGPPSGKAVPDYVFGQAPEYFAIRLANDRLAPGLPADDVYATDVRMAMEYSLARLMPDTGPKRIAVFARPRNLASAESLVDRIPYWSRLGGTSPAHIAEALRGLEPESRVLAAGGRLYFKRWIEGIQWNADDPEGATTLPVDVPRAGRPSFAVTIAPPPDRAAGTFVVSVTSPDGAREDLQQVTEERATPPVARDVSVDLSKWRGRRVGVRLVYRPQNQEAATPGWLIWMEPRLVILQGALTSTPPVTVGSAVTDRSPPRP